MALDSFPITRRALGGSITVADADCLHDPFRFGPGEIDGQQSVLQVGTQNLHAVSEHEAALKLPCRNTAVEVLPLFVVLLPAADDELILLDRHIELIARESGNRQRNAQALRLAV